MNKRILFAFIAIFSHLYPCLAQQQQFYGQGKLSSNLITKIIQDASGFIWIGTENGLNKFDGWKFTHYFNNNNDTASLAGNSVEALFTDREGLLWIGSNEGLQYYCPEDDKFRSVEFPGDISPSVKDAVQLHTGEIWAVTAGYGVFLIDKSIVKATSLSEINDRMNSGYAVRIFQDRARQIWIGLSDNRMACISPDRNKVQTYQLPIDSRHKIYGMAEDDSGRMFVATSADVFLWDNIRKEYIPVHKEEQETITIRGIVQLNDGRICIHTIGQGVKYIDSDSMLLRTPSRLPNGYENPKGERISAFFEDKDGNFWLGYYKKGLSVKLNESIHFEFWDLSAIREEGAYFTAVVAGNNLWVGTEHGKLFRLDNQGNIDESWQLPIDISSLFEDKKNTFWVGSYSDGLGIFDRQTGRYASVPQFENKFINVIEEDHKNDLYVSVLGEGFVRYNSLTGEWIPISDTVVLADSSRLFNNWIGDILCDSDGLIWLAQSTGVDCYDPEKHLVLNFPDKSEFRSYGAIVLLEDNKKNIWIGTNNGLFRYGKNDNSLTYYGINDGLPNNVICGLGTDSKGNIWGSTQNGLFQLDVKDERIASYYSGNGLIDREYFKGVSLQDKDGYIYFGGLRGITRFMPDSIQPQQLDYHPVLTHLYINNGSVSARTEINNKPVADTQLVDASGIRLSYREKTFSLEFSTMNFHNKENIIFEYRLLGINGEWSKTFPGENRITYNSLSPGNYTLEVRAFENNTYSPTKSLSIQIAPPWYVTVWAIFLYIFLFAGLLAVGLIRWYKRRAKRREERNNEEKLKFFINIAHEIRSPLTLILSPLFELSKQEHDKDTAKLLRTMQRNADRIMNLINQLLDIRKIDKGQMSIRCEETDLVDFIKELLQVFDHQSSKRNIRLSFEPDTAYLPVWIDRNNFDKVLMNLLVNAFKFTPNGGEILIYLRVVQKNMTKKSLYPCAEIQILDSGTGLNEKEIERIFERFYQASSQSSLGFGIGLNLTKMLIELHHGTIQASNRSDAQGSCFTIHLPLGRDHLATEEIVQEPHTTRIALETPVYWEEKESNIVESKNKARKKVLVVDDDEEIREYLQRELGHIYKVITGKNGVEALQVLLRQRIDLIVSDVKMPEMDGFTLLKKIRSNNNISHIPVILLTSQVEFQTRMKGWNVGADGFMDKPFQIEELFLLCDNLITNRSLLRGKFVGIRELEGKVSPLEVESNDDLFIDRLMNLINRNLDNPKYSVETLAKEVGISRTQLHRKLKEITGITTSDFIRNVRLKQAAKLLLEKKINISQVAYATGFTNPTIFAVAFKKFYGCTPTEYMEKGGQYESDSDR